MLNLNKYLKKAKTDSEFKRRLLQDANRAIKDEFGEELPYKLKCKVKLVFEIEPSDGLSDDDLSDVAGGTPWKNLIPLDIWKERIQAEGYTLSTSILGRNGKGVYRYTMYDYSGVPYTYDVSLIEINGKWYAKVKYLLHIIFNVSDFRTKLLESHFVFVKFFTHGTLQKISTKNILYVVKYLCNLTKISKIY